MADVGMVVVAPAASFHHTHHHHHHHEAAAAAAAAGDPIFPLLSGGPCVLDPDAAAKGAAPGQGGAAIQFWQPHSPPSAAANPNPSAASPFAYLKKPLPMLDTGAGSSSAAGAATCQDCGNQAKKDCCHNRCRTCCKSRGFDCSTHVKSTWVPAARRRERQQIAGSGSASSSPAAATASAAAAAAASASKKPRLLSSQTTTSHTSTSNATTPRSFDTTSSHQDASFRDSLPRQVRAPAVFKCVRVTSIEDGEDEYAYQATVTINGHLFKGFLYDQGPDDGRHHAATSNEDSATAGVPNISELHLGAASASGPGGSGASMAPTDLYGGGGGHHHILGGGSGYGGNTMN
ncbi:hypothetical protein BS78_03G405600 [Paspalum vaginatum]|nr:hypothetical protein BS78_03G405600 [Paspalum vaginatum]KAJ1287117.1 hypothetical protein BS78_03G405600 [Paspalum vaginatum]KAJ1287118.1 hypothetical protein BS78_03G405600 [Paspalum vaginatum]